MLSSDRDVINYGCINNYYVVYSKFGFYYKITKHLNENSFDHNQKNLQINRSVKMYIRISTTWAEKMYKWKLYSM